MKRLKTTLALILVIFLLLQGHTAYADESPKHTADSELGYQESLIFGIDDDISIDISFGGRYNFTIQPDSELPYEKDVINSVRLVLKNDSGKETCIRYLDDNYVSEEYQVNNAFNAPGVKYNHTETVTIPKSLLDKQSGYVQFCVMGIWGDESEESVISTVCLCYKKSDKEIQITERDIEKYTELFVEQSRLDDSGTSIDPILKSAERFEINPYFNRYLFKKIESYDVRSGGDIIMAFRANGKTHVLSYFKRTGNAYVEIFDYDGRCAVEWPQHGDAEILLNEDVDPPYYSPYWVHFIDAGISKYYKGNAQYSICDSETNREVAEKLLSGTQELKGREYSLVGDFIIFSNTDGRMIYPLTAGFIIVSVVILAIAAALVILTVVLIKRRRRKKT